MKSTDSVLRSASRYIRHGYRVVPIPPKKKGPRKKNWPELRIKKSEIREHFNEGDNIGIVLGHGLVDIDLDCEDAIGIAARYLPKTERVHGRKSRPASHFWFRTKPSMKSEKFSDPDGNCLVEIRSSTGQQTVVPPSMHESGERLRWTEEGEPSLVDAGKLRIAVKRIAAVALIAKRWKTGSRNGIVLPLSGALLRAGWKKEKVIKLVKAIAFAAGDDELKERVAAVESTYRKFKEGNPVTGIPTLVEVLGERTVNCLCPWLGIEKEKSENQLKETDWQDIFHSVEDFENAPPTSFSIEGFLQDYVPTVIAGPSGDGKTLILHSIMKALLSQKKHKKLWGHFRVLKTASRVVYLIPESGITPVKDRLKRFNLYRYVKTGQLLVRTLSKGPAPELTDPKILAAAKGAYVFLDPTVRFEKGDENGAFENQVLAKAMFAVLAHAKAVVATHHAPKKFNNDMVMTLEKMLRGSGDIGAMFATAWGIKQLDEEKNIIHIENIKSRDFEPGRPFQIIGRPYINDEGDFRMLKRPGECGSLSQEQKSFQNRGGAPPKKRKAKEEKLEVLRSLMQKHPKAEPNEIGRRYKKLTGKALKEGTLRPYLKQIREEKSGSKS